MSEQPSTVNRPRGGRPLGSRNKRTLEGEEFARSIVNDPEYRAITRKRAFAGELPPAVEQTLLHYAFGKPKEHVDVHVSTDDVDLSALTAEELAQYAEQLALGIRQGEIHDAMIEARIAEREAEFAQRELLEARKQLQAAQPGGSDEA